MKLERILSALDQNRIRATIDAVAGLAGSGTDELMPLLAADTARARWVVSSDTCSPVIRNGHPHLTEVTENPMVIRDSARLRVLVLATELTATAD